MRERNIYWLPLKRPQMGTWPATQACALIGNQAGDFSVCGMTHNPLNQTSQDKTMNLYLNWNKPVHINCYTDLLTRVRSSMLYIFNCMGILKLCKKLPPNTNVSVGVYTA